MSRLLLKIQILQHRWKKCVDHEGRGEAIEKQTSFHHISSAYELFDQVFYIFVFYNDQMHQFLYEYLLVKAPEFDKKYLKKAKGRNCQNLMNIVTNMKRAPRVVWWLTT